MPDTVPSFQPVEDGPSSSGLRGVGGEICSSLDNVVLLWLLSEFFFFVNFKKFNYDAS